jgi:hypothetical protein
LATQDEILSFNRPPTSDRKPHQADEVGEQQNDPSESDHMRIMSPQRSGSSTRGYRSVYCGPQPGPVLMRRCYSDRLAIR